MKNTLLYIVTVVIWGSTWLAIEYQLGEVAIELSLTYRFGLAAIIMWGYCLWKRFPMKFSLKNHGFVLMLAAFNFSSNYLLMYWAQEYLSSAMASIAFSTLLLMNIINTRIFFGKPIAARIYIGALIGVVGIVVLFWSDLKDINLSNTSVLGLILVLGGTLVASIGNMVSVRNSAKGIGIFQANAWGMMYGTFILVIYSFAMGTKFSISFAPSYIISLLYLAIFGTVIAFACYFLLLKNIGPERASYAIVLFPLVAVVLSTLFEGFEWSESTVLGFTLVLLGNVIVLTPKEKVLIFIRNGFLKSKISEPKVVQEPAKTSS